MDLSSEPGVWLEEQQLGDRIAGALRACWYRILPKLLSTRAPKPAQTPLSVSAADLAVAVVVVVAREGEGMAARRRRWGWGVGEYQGSHKYSNRSELFLPASVLAAWWWRRGRMILAMDFLVFARPLLVQHVQVQCCFTSTETVRTVRDGETRTATSDFAQLLNCELVSIVQVQYELVSVVQVQYERLVLVVQVQCCFTSTETVLVPIRSGKPRKATSTFTKDYKRIYNLCFLHSS